MKSLLFTLLAFVIVLTAASQPYRVRQVGLSDVQREKMAKATIAGAILDRAGSVEKLGAERLSALRPGAAPSGSVDYGAYR